MAAGLSADGDPEETAAGPQGLSWSWELDLPELLGALAARADDGMAAGDAPAGPEDQEAVLDDICSAEAAGQARSLGTAEVAGRVAEYLPPGPGLAALLGRTPAAALRSRDLPAVAAGFRRLASWAQAAELSAVAQIAARAAAADADIGVLSDGRPARIGEDATAQVSLALVMSQFGSSWWTDLAVTLAWRLPGTGAALSAGDIDLTRARLIADATSALGEDAARAVEEAVLADAGCATPGQLRAALRRAVIAADPAGAEQRRKDAERRAKVGLYPDDEGTATLAGQNLPAIQAAAAFARITALARARKAAGDAGGIDLHRAQVMIGLLLGTLPYIPPAKDAPPDEPPHDGSPTDGSPPSDGPPPAGRPPRDDAPADEPPREDRPRPGSRPTNDPPPADDRQPPDDASAGHDGGECADGWLPRDTDAPEDEGLDPEPAFLNGGDDDDDDWLTPGLPWPGLPGPTPLGGTPLGANLGGTPPGGIPPGRAAGTTAAAPGLLDLSLPWRTLAGLAPLPGLLGRIGPITALQARQLAGHATLDPAVAWWAVVTDSCGQALAVARIPRRSGRQPGRDGPEGSGLVGRVIVTISADTATGAPGPDCTGVAAAALRAAATAARRATARAAADADAGGCAHLGSTIAYRPSPLLHQYITARDQTCRFPRCRQPAWRGDLDHTVPYGEGGRTCRCNLGGLCRFHHRLKQRRGWTLRQHAPGLFKWTTPVGRSYLAGPDAHSS